MKKQIIIALLSFSSLLGFTQTKNDTLVSKVQQSVLESIPDSSALTFKEVYSDIKSGLGALGSALKVGSEHVYEVLVKQQFANSITSLSLIIISLIVLTILIKQGSKNLKIHSDLGKNERYWHIDDSRFGTIGSILFVFAGLLGILIMVGICANFNNLVTGFVNPEYGAIKEVLKVIK